MLKRCIATILCVTFILTGIMPPAMAQELFLPAANVPVGLTQPAAPCILRGMKVDAQNPLHMDFLVDKGRASLSQEDLNAESMRSIRYFLASLTLPEKDIWVNLSPYENDRIVPEDLGRTGMGRDLLAQDYILKQLTAGLLHPDGATGKVFWAEVYKRAHETYGTTDIPVDTFNKVWIVPAKSVVYESRSANGKEISAYVDEMKLKVMLEIDYAASKALDGAVTVKQGNGASQTIAKDVLREVVIPVLEKEVNEGANFAMLRQVCYALTLSVWLKKKLMTSAYEAAAQEMTGGNILAKVFINRHKTGGIEIADPRQQTQRIYDRYVEAFKVGAYNLIKEEVDTYSQELIPRKYFSGGLSVENAQAVMKVLPQVELLAPSGDFAALSVDLAQADNNEFRKVGDNSYEWTNTSLTGKDSTRKKKQISSSGFVTKVLAGIVLSATLYFGYVGVNSLLKDKFADKIEQVSGKVMIAQDVIDILENLGRNNPSFERARSGKGAKVYSKKMLLERMTGKAYSEESAETVAKMFQQYFDDFCPGIKAAGLTARDIFELAVSVMLIESDFQQVRAQNDALNAAPAFGFFQFERNTIETLTWVEVFRLFMEREGAYLTPNGVDLKAKFKEFLNIKASLMNSDNSWKIAKVKKSPMQLLDVQVALVLMSWEDTFTRDFVAKEEGFLRENRDVFKRYGITIPSKIQKRIDAKYSAPKTSVDILMEKYPQLTRKQIVSAMLAANHKVGGPRTLENYVQIMDFLVSDQRARDKYLKDASDALDQAISARSVPLANLRTFLKGRGIVFSDSDWSRFGSGNSNILKSILQRLKKRNPSDLTKFATLYFNDWTPLSVMRDKQRDLGDGNAGKYAFWAVNILARDVPSLKEGTQETEQVRKDKAKKNKAKKDKAQIVGNDQAINGGIDLAGQEAVMDVRGNSGSFGLNLSPAQIKMLDEDVRGFSPIIINIKPVSDVKMFLGFQTDGAAAATS